jgi:hypothetical protein
MKAIELVGNIDDQNRLEARVPEGVRSGPVRVVVYLPDEDDAGAAWTRGLAKEWESDLADPQQDIYTLADGQPVNAAR